MPDALELHPRRWSAKIALAFAIVFALAGAYSVLLAWVLLPGKLGIALAAMFAFATICIAGTTGRAALATLRRDGPALVVDEHGLTDRVQDIGPIPWQDIERVVVDGYENRILVRLVPDSGSDRSSNAVTRALYRMFVGGDVTLVLHGLRYDERELTATVRAFHARARKA